MAPSITVKIPSRHPKVAHYGEPQLTGDDVMASRMIASPFRLLGCAITAEGDGGINLTVTLEKGLMPMLRLAPFSTEFNSREV